MHSQEVRADDSRSTTFARGRGEGTRWAMLTAYDFPTAQILDRGRRPRAAGRRLRRPQRPGLRERAARDDGRDAPSHTAVARGAEHAMVVGDMPFMSFQASIDDGMRNAGRLIKEGGAHAVKIEGPQPELTHRLVDIGHPGDGPHRPDPAVGLRAGRLQGAGPRRGGPAGARPGPRPSRRPARSRSCWRRCRRSSAPRSPRALQIPTIGIGAGAATDAQVLVINDLLGINEKPPKLAKKYADLRAVMTEAVDVLRRRRRVGRLPRQRPQLLLASRRAGAPA